MKTITYKELQSGEINGAVIFEITSIPVLELLGAMTIDDAEKKHGASISTLLNEIYQEYKTILLTGAVSDISLEFLWMTKPVMNQPYEANITIYLLIRCIGDSEDSVKIEMNNICRICVDSLQSMKYDYKEIGYDEFMAQYAGVEEKNVRAIVKEEILKNLHNPFYPVCYSYDVIPENNLDLSRLIDSLIKYPNCALSIQIMPTYYTADERNAIEQTIQVIDNLGNGIGLESYNGMKYTLADDIANVYHYYEKYKNEALFNFNVLIYGSEEAVSNVSTKVYGYINSATKETVGLKFIEIETKKINRLANFYPLPWAINEYLLKKDRNQAIWDSGIVDFDRYRLPYIISAEEASNFFRLPIANENIGAGLSVNDSKRNSKAFADNVINSGDIAIGNLNSNTDSEIRVSINDLTKHMLVVGTPGCGKTTFSVGLLDRLWKDYKIPFLVIEPAKNEYRAMLKSIPDLQIFTPGKNFISPFVFNPFLPPKNVKLETYKSTLKTAFSAAVSMTTPLDKIFEEAINNCYSDNRWLDTYTVDDEGRVFNISDFIKCFQKTFDDIGYTGDAKNIGRAGTVRLNGLVNLFDNYSSIPIEDILTKPTVIELTAIENSDEKALIISLLLLSILAYINADYVGKGNLKNIILLEEAHVLFDTGTAAGEANPSDIAQRLIKRMLAEARAYGVGLVIADQSPRKVTTDVVALTDIKLGFRLVEADDKTIFADSTGMDDYQKNKLARLKPGEAFLFFNKLEEPEEIRTEDYRGKNDIDITITDDEVKVLSKYWQNRSQMLKPYPECKCVSCCDNTCDYNRRILSKDIARRIYVKNFKQSSNEFELVKKVFGRISSLIKSELNSEPFNSELLSCVKVHLWRRIKYNTKIPVSDKLIENSLKKN